MKFELDQIESQNGGIWISKKELERKYKELRQKGYHNNSLYVKSGNNVCLYESIKCHSKADVLWDLICLICD